MIINKSVPDISIPFLTGGAAALFASICLPPMLKIGSFTDPETHTKHFVLQPFSKKWNLAKKAVAQVRIDAVNMKFDWGKLRNTLKFKNRAS